MISFQKAKFLLGLLYTIDAWKASAEILLVASKVTQGRGHTWLRQAKRMQIHSTVRRLKFTSIPT